LNSDGILRVGFDANGALQGVASRRHVVVDLLVPNVDRGVASPATELSVVLDASGSMTEEGKMDHAKASAKAIARQLDAADHFSLVTFGDDAAVVLPSDHVTDHRRIERAIDGIYESGGTNLYAGLVRAGRELDGGDGNRRLVLVSDGRANVGVKDPDAIVSVVSGLADAGVVVSTVGLGLEFQEDLLLRMATVGHGSYTFVDDASDLSSALDAELEAARNTVYQDVVLTLSFDGVEGVRLLGGTPPSEDGEWRISLGDLAGGQHVRLVAEVMASGTGHAAARAEVTFRDEERRSSLQSSARLHYTTEPAAVSASIDAERNLATQRALAAEVATTAIDAFAQHRPSEAKRLLESLSEGLKSVAATTPGLQRDVVAVESLLHTVTTTHPKTPEGKRAIKRGKENFRGRIR
jgi:Ca-activated chloride channel family protein